MVCCARLGYTIASVTQRFHRVTRIANKTPVRRAHEQR